MDSSESNKLNDKSPDHSNFIQIPNIVYLLSRNPYDYMFWATVKSIAWRDGSECYVTTKELAELSCMSESKAINCRTYLMKVGLLEGKLEKIPGSSVKSVWHLTIPPLWGLNEQFTSIYKSWKDRLAYKRKQASSLKEQKEEDKLSQIESSFGEFSQTENFSGEDSKNGQENSSDKFSVKLSSCGEDDVSLEKFDVLPETNNSILTLKQKEEDNMMPKINPFETWSLILEQLSQLISKRDFENMLTKTSAVKWIGYTLVVATPNPFVLEWLNQKIKPYVIKIIQPIVENKMGNVKFELGINK